MSAEGPDETGKVDASAPYSFPNTTSAEDRDLDLAGGAGSPGNPGQAAWNAILGRGWSHDYAERIVPDPSVPRGASG